MMRSLRYILPCLLALPAMASTYTVTAPHLTMHAGDPVPPLIFSTSTYTGSYAGVFTGEPERSTTATPSSPAGNYPITLATGTLKTVDPNDTVQLVSGVLTVLAAEPIGAKLSNDIHYPAGFLQGSGGYAALDVTKNSLVNLVGDCKTDNAAAFDKLLSQGGQRTSATTNGGAMPLFLYFPAGCYATSQPLTIYGNTWTFWGAGPQKSYIRLLPNSAAFNTGKPTQFFSPQSVTRNSNFREYIYNLGFNIGVGNPDAIPFTTVQNNSGAVRDVQIWADDSRCPYAISFTRAYPGPMLFNDVAVYGCKMAYSSVQNEYSITFENFTTEAQTTVALDNHLIETSIRHWLSDNTVQALHVYGGMTANVAVLDSELLNGAPAGTGIAVEKGSALYLKNVSVTGYGVTEIDSGAGEPVKRLGNITQAWTGEGKSLFNHEQQPDSLHLEVRETPEPKDAPLGQWTKLTGSIDSWKPQIEHAASATVYAPPGLYSGVGTTEIVVPDSVNHLQFYQSKPPAGGPQIVLRIAGSSTTPLVIDACLYEACQIVHTGRRTVVLRDTTLNSYEAQDGAGDVYIEDSMLSIGSRGQPTVSFYASQHVWARQLNLEQRVSPKLSCSGCKLWILGYKTEQPSSCLLLSNRAEAEIFGFFYYMNVGPGAPGTATMQLSDSSLFAFGWQRVDQPGRGHPNWVIESQGAKSDSLATRDVDSSQQMTMFYSFGGAASGKGAGEKKDAQQKN